VTDKVPSHFRCARRAQLRHWTDTDMSGTEIPTLSLDAATAADASLLGNLLELYSHELSDVFPSVVLGPDGRFGYPALPLYWSEIERRFAYLIRVDGQVAGFVLATRGSPAAADPQVMDVAEFFVLRRYRRRGFGQGAVRLLWKRLPGRWTVRVAEGNSVGLAFWASLLAAQAHAGVTESVRQSGSMSWRVFTFDTAIMRKAVERIAGADV
jgi:predicted acetyltransferase